MLIINQGNHKVEEERTYSIMTEEKALLKVTSLKLNDKDKSLIDITFTVMEGTNKGRLVFDRFGYLPTSTTEWKYKAIRSACGVPYTANENQQIDIEGMLLNKALNAKLYSRKGTDGAEHQGITYIRAPKVETVFEDATVETDDSNLPW